MSNTQPHPSQNGTAVTANPNGKESILEKLKKNIERTQEAKSKMGGNFLRIESGETKVLQFTGDIEPVQRSFKRKKEDGTEEQSTKTLFSYKVMDLNSQDEGVKIWEVSKSWSDSIDNLLVEGFLTLKVKRTGAGTDTNYLFSPVVSQ